MSAKAGRTEKSLQDRLHMMQSVTQSGSRNDAIVHISWADNHELYQQRSIKVKKRIIKTLLNISFWNLCPHRKEAWTWVPKARFCPWKSTQPDARRMARKFTDKDLLVLTIVTRFATAEGLPNTGIKKCSRVTQKTWHCLTLQTSRPLVIWPTWPEVTIQKMDSHLKRENFEKILLFKFASRRHSGLTRILLLSHWTHSKI